MLKFVLLLKFKRIFLLLCCLLKMTHYKVPILLCRMVASTPAIILYFNQKKGNKGRIEDVSLYFHPQKFHLSLHTNVKESCDYTS